MKHLFAILIIFAFFNCQSQDDLDIKQFKDKKDRLQHDGMLVLTSWAGANIVGSAIGYSLTNRNEEKEFFIMNGAWGLINLSLSLPGLLAKPKPLTTLYDLQKEQTKFEKIFLANAVLDVAYVTGGFFLKEYASNQAAVKDQERYNGFGNSIILQGVGLMAFDMAMTILNSKNRRKNLDPILKKTYVSFSGNSFRIGIRL